MAFSQTNITQTATNRARKMRNVYYPDNAVLDLVFGVKKLSVAQKMTKKSSRNESKANAKRLVIAPNITDAKYVNKSSTAIQTRQR